MRKGIITSLVVLIGTPLLWASQQNYEAIMLRNTTEQRIKVESTSRIIRGIVRPFEIRLLEIPDNQSGYIEFWPEHQVDDRFDVALKGLVSNNNYAFKFENNVYTIEVPSGLVPKPYVEPDTYAITDKFRIEKCGGAIRFYKNDILLYEHCLVGAGEAVYHQLFVYKASTTDISLLFDDDIPDCTTSFTGGGTNESVSLERPKIETQSVVDDLDRSKKKRKNKKNKKKEEERKTEIHVWKPHTTVRVVAFNQHDEPVRQWRIRTNAQGILPPSHESWKYVNEGFQVRVFSSEDEIKRKK